ncbi:MAG: sulfite exporter TauE/SafE family protein [Deltaproteobacteria bacterium]|nr:sulfite exporter TauE/SafE family protein [Deltaproteobacteria bacterium]MCW5803199.1 sulfite exporter TauE/SafE family protein [Deltaproteobacteria bacterium]
MTATVVALFGVALLGFGIEGAIGFGGTVIAASVGAQLVPLDELLPAFVPVNMLLSAWLLATGVRAVAWRTLAVEVAPMVALGAVAGLALFHVPAKTALALAFGVFVVGLAALQLARPAREEPPTAARAAMLVLGGVAHGLFGTGGPMIVYAVRRRIADKRAFRASLAVLWLSLNVALLVNFASLDLYRRETLDLGAAIALAVVPGLVIGERIHRALDTARFERLVWVGLVVAGGALAARSALAL